MTSTKNTWNLWGLMQLLKIVSSQILALNGVSPSPQNINDIEIYHFIYFNCYSLWTELIAISYSLNISSTSCKAYTALCKWMNNSEITFDIIWPAKILYNWQKNSELLVSNGEYVVLIPWFYIDVGHSSSKIDLKTIFFSSNRWN